MFLGPVSGRHIGDMYGGEPSRGRAVLGSIPSGVAGMRETLRIMRDRVRDAIRNPDQVIRQKALDIVSGLPPRQFVKEVKSLHEFVRDNIRYVRDPVSVELVQTPEATLDIGQGDCDDKSTLLAALLDATGHPSRFCAVAFNNDGFSHVLVETKIDHTGDDRRDWMPLETIIPKPAGWFPSGVTGTYRLKV